MLDKRTLGSARTSIGPEYRSLRMIMSTEAVSVQIFLWLMIPCVQALSRLHDTFAIHGRLIPENIMINIAISDVQFIGQGSEDPSTAVDTETLQYMAPEQTGRLRRHTDHRSDIYSLGIIFYELVNGRLPYSASEPIEWVHAHIALNPSPMNGDIPEMVQRVILKCMEKMPENRYQSLFGLHQDLLRIRNETLNLGEREDFPIALKDAPSALRISRKLYGRVVEMDQLRSLYSRVQRDQSGAVFLVGDQGIGKSVILDELVQTYSHSNSYVAVGRAAIAQQLTPFAPIEDICHSLVQRILTLDGAALATWRSDLAPLSTGSGILFEWVPELELIIPPPVKTDTKIMATLFAEIVRDLRFFLSQFASPENPLVICLDDLQWVDQSTARLIEHLIYEGPSQNVMWVMAVRKRVPQHIRQLQTFGKNYTDLHVETLTIYMNTISTNDITFMLVDTLKMPALNLQPLAEIIFLRTIGNPFFIRQFMLELISKRYLHFHSELETWHILYDEIRRMSVTENVAELLTKQIQDLPGTTLHVLQYAACAGPDIRLSMLARAFGEEMDALLKQLRPAIDHGFFLLESERADMHLRFAHQQARKAFLSQVTPLSRKQIHDCWGQILMEEVPIAEQDIYRIVNHLNRGVRDPAKRHTLAEWNLAAGIKARNSAAFSTALFYFTMGFSLLQDGDWETHHDLMWSLLFGRTRAELTVGHFVTAEKLIEQSVERSITEEEMVQVALVKIEWLTHFSRTREALDEGVKGLRQLGLMTPQRANLGLVLMALLEVLGSWRFRSLHALEKLPDMSDPRRKGQTLLLDAMGMAAFREDPKLQVQLSLKLFSLTMRYGYSPTSGVGYSEFAMVLGNVFGKVKWARRFGLLAIRAAERSQLAVQSLNATFTFATYINFWTAPMVSSLDLLRRSHGDAVISGHIMMQGATNGFTFMMKWYIGTSLQELYILAGEYHPIARRNKDTLFGPFYEILQPVLSWLHLGLRSEASLVISFDAFSDRNAIAFTATVLLQAYYILGEFEKARELSYTAHHEMNPVFVDMNVPEWTTLQALLIGEDASTRPQWQRYEAARQIKRSAAKLRKWAREAPSNYWHKELLLQAECEVLRDHHKSALDLYERAALQASESGYVHYAAIAYERAGVACRAAGHLSLASWYMDQAMRRYSEWQAFGKIQQLKQKYPDLIDQGDRPLPRSMVATSLDDFARDLDVNTIIDVTRSISEEVILERLLRKLMGSMVLHAGAERGVILLARQEDGFYVEAEGGSKDDSVRLHAGDLSLSQYERLPHAVVYYVARTRESLLLSDVRRDPRFSSDPYIVLGKAISVMCLPILRLGQLIGVVYLEHAVVPQLFTQRQLRIVSIIGAQAAVSIENAYVYETLEVRIQDRTDALQVSNQTLREINERLFHSETLRRQMISDISHDLRTPLTSIQGYIEAVMEGMVDPENVSKYLAVARDRTVQIDHLIQDLLDLSKLDERYGILQCDMISLLDLAHSIARKHEFDVSRAGLSFQLSFDEKLSQMDNVDWDHFMPEQEIFVNVDARRMDQVFGNLISNAIRHTPAGGQIMLWVGLCRSLDGGQVPPGASATHAMFCVQDTGNGIPEDELLNIFERFYRVDRSRNKDSGGNGLGLAISKAIIENHDGRIWADSEVGKGSTFSVVLPIAAFVAGHQGELLD